MAVARELFVYWKGPRSEAPRAESGVIEYQQALRQRHPMLQARLLQRADESGDSITWMEIYAAPPGGITPQLQAQIEAAAAPLQVTLGAGPRHVELFETTAR